MGESHGFLAGKIAIVTGGARGVGRAVSEAFVREGATVVVADNGDELDGSGASGEVIEETGAPICGAGAYRRLTDVSNPEQAFNLVSDCTERYGKLDILVNCAAIMRHGSIHETDEGSWRSVLDVNLGGTFNTTRAAAQYWVRNGTGGRLINFGSDAGVIGVANEVAYSVSKAAVINLTLCCARTLHEYGVTCNVVHPQAKTRLTASIPRRELPDAERWDTDEFSPEHVAPAVVHLASEEGAWITGRVIAAFGYEVHLYGPAGRRRSIYNNGPWDADSIGRRMREAFGSVEDSGN